MNLQPYQTPPTWWSPRLSGKWMHVLRPLRRSWGRYGEGLVEVDVHGAEHLQHATAEQCGVLIAPNHPSHADAYAMLGASDALRMPFYFMTAWQVFERTHAVGRFILRRHGCFSINREGHDIRAMRQAVSILRHGTSPLVIFPEGEVYHLNDRVMPFRRGAIRLAQMAAARTTRPVVSIPTAIRYSYVDDPTPGLQAVMSQLERTVGMVPSPAESLVQRIHHLSMQLLRESEQHYLGRAGAGSLERRRQKLVAAVLTKLEEQLAIVNVSKSVPERVKEVRRRIIERRTQSGTESGTGSSRRRWQSAMDDAFFVMQLFSYPVDYLDGDAPVERIAETMDKLEEDLLGVSTTYARGRRRATVTFGEPLLVDRLEVARDDTRRLTAELQQRVYQLLEPQSASAKSPRPMVAAPLPRCVSEPHELVGCHAAC